MAEAKVTRKGERVEIGNDQARVERGPALRSAKATPTILANDKTAPHYQIGAPDSFGRPIEEGKEFAYLDHYGDPTFYLFERVAIGPDDSRYKHQVDPFDPNGGRLNEDTTNTVAYRYVFEERGTFDSEDDAIAEGKRLVAAQKE